MNCSTLNQYIDLIKMMASAFIGAAVAIISVVVSNYYANKRLLIEIKEKEKDRGGRLLEKLSDHVISAHLEVLQVLIKYKNALYFQSALLSGDYFWGLVTPKENPNFIFMFNELGDLIIAKEIWLQSSCTEQLRKLWFELQEGREAELQTHGKSDDEVSVIMGPVYSRVISEVDKSINAVRNSIGLDNFDRLAGRLP